MANQKAVSMTVGGSVLEIVIWYNDANMRIGNVEWNIPDPGYAVRVLVWDSNVSPTVPIIDETLGQGSGAQTISGNYWMVEVTDPEFGPELRLPPNITYTFKVRTI